MSLYPSVVRSTVRPKTSIVSPLLSNTHFLYKELLFQLLHHVSNESIISREKFIVSVNVLKEISVANVERIVDLSGFESKIFRCLSHSVFPKSW